VKRGPLQWEKCWLVLIIISGGLLVLGSYIYGVVSQPGAADILWGGVPQGIRPIYTANMLLAAASFFVYTYFILYQINSKEQVMSNPFGYWIFHLLYAAILYPSAMWLPLTFKALAHTSIFLLWLVRIVLVVVGLASFSLLIVFWKSKPNHPFVFYWLTIAGSGFFCIQTAVLDAIVWNIFFRL
jgi:hypothetical protein